MSQSSSACQTEQIMLADDASASPMRPRVWGVAALLQAVSDNLATRFGTSAVRGEICAFVRAASGHCYFQLKDAQGQAAQIRCVMFRRVAEGLSVRPVEGLAVEVQGQLTLYEPRGDLQFVVEAMRPAGSGSLYEQFLRLRARLEAEGLFANERKRPVPAFPRSVGIVTSSAGAALHDVLAALARRAPHVRVVVYPCLVQGAQAPDQIVQALGQAARRAEADTLIVCRGGGSLEDLWAFNDERVVRAIAGSPIPVICGIGHETDSTLADFAADLRAPTPTAAAELAAPARQALLEGADHLAHRLHARTRRVLDSHAQRLDRLSLQLLRPGQALQRRSADWALWQQRLRTAAWQATGLCDHRLSALAERMVRAGRQAPRDASRRVGVVAARLQALDPARVLARGYAWMADANGRPIGSVADVQAGEQLQARLADGRLWVEVSALLPEPGPPTSEAIVSSPDTRG